MDQPDNRPTRHAAARERFRLGLAGTAVFLLVVAVGATVSYVRNLPLVTSAAETSTGAESHATPDGKPRSGLEHYVRSLQSKGETATAEKAPSLPDVDTLIERLALRLQTTPQDITGWRTLGWSYFHTARYHEAATAYAKALELDPNSSELKSSYDEARAKAAASGVRKPAE